MTLDEKRSYAMKPRITIITLCVDDLERAVQFYRDGLGLPTQAALSRRSSVSVMRLSIRSRGAV